MNNTLVNYLIILLVSILLVLGFTFAFGCFYNKVRPKPSYEVSDYKVEIKVKNKDGSICKVDSCQYIITPSLKIKDNPTDASDYSSYLVSFISVLATFVVIANFANARDLISSAENAEKAEKAVNEAKIKVEGSLEQLEVKIQEVNGTLTEVKQLKGKVEATKITADESMSSSTQLVENLNRQIEDKLQHLTEQIEELNTSISNAKTELTSKQTELYKRYDEVVLLTKKSEENLSRQRAELDAASTRLAKVENKMDNISNASPIDNEVAAQEQHDTAQTNIELPSNVDISNNKA